MDDDCKIDDYPTDNKRRKWHIGKEIPLATVMVLLAQTIGVIWWAASISAKVESVEKAAVATQVVQTATDGRQDSESRRSEDRILVQLDKVSAKIDRLIETRR